VEDETLIGITLLLVGIFIIFIGFFMIMISVALGILQDSKARQDYSGRTESESFRKGANFGETRDSSRSPYEKPPAEKAQSKVKGGGVIMIGPIPIIFGSDKESAKSAAILAIILMLLSLLILKGWLF
jgi:uncharacterized protein (TIGR00304 family)